MIGPYTSNSGCGVAGCGARAVTVVEIDLPASWDGAKRFTTLTLHVAACRRHAPEFERRNAAMLEARSDYADVLALMIAAARSEARLMVCCEQAEIAAAGLRGRLARAESDLAGADLALIECEGALAYEREQHAETRVELAAESWRTRGAWRWGEPFPSGAAS